MPGDLLVHKLGRLVTRLLLLPSLRGSPRVVAAYTALYLAGKSLADRRERRFLERQVSPGMVVLDVGANVGFYTLLFARRVGPQGQVYAFEPDPFCRQILAHRCRREGLHNVEVAAVALADRRGTARLYCGRVNRADNRIYASPPDTHGETLEVAVATLDGYCADHGVARVDAIKIDVQGAEVAVLSGMRETIRRRPPRWMFVELSPALLRYAGTEAAQLWALLDEYGCTAQVCARGRLSPIADRAELVRRYETSYVDLWVRCDDGPPAR